MRKTWQQSFVVWFNGALVAIAMTTETINQVAPFIPAKYEPIHAKVMTGLGVAAALINIWARVFKTAVPINAPPPDPGA